MTQSQISEEDRYWSLIESTQRIHYPDFVRHLEEQKGLLRQEGKVAMINLVDNSMPSVKVVENPTDLRAWLESSMEEQTPTRRLVILQGMPRSFIQILGVRFNIPPSFFAAHWATPDTFEGRLVNRIPRHYNGQSRFHLSLVKIHQARISAQPEDSAEPFYSLESTIPRLVSCHTIFGEADGPLTSKENVSFWGLQQGANWDVQAIILVDQPLGKTVMWKTFSRDVIACSRIQLPNVSSDLTQRGSWYPPYQYEPASNVKDWLDQTHVPCKGSLFADMVSLYSSTKRQSTKDVNSCTDVCRKLVLSEWTARLRIIEAQIAHKQINLSFGDATAAQNTDQLFDLSWGRLWRPREFCRLVLAKSAMKSIQIDLRQNLHALRVHAEEHEHQILSSWEVDAWNDLQDVIQILSSRVEDILETYMQAATVRQSISAGQLAAMATVFIPVSLLAAIFSMGGQFAAGESLFWVFWVIATPVALLGCLFLFTKLGARLSRRISVARSLV